MNTLDRLRDWACSHRLTGVPPAQLKKPVQWSLPAVITQPITICGFDLWQLQHLNRVSEEYPIQVLRNLMTDLSFRLPTFDYNLPSENAEWLGTTSDHLTFDQKGLRNLLWLIADLSPGTDVLSERAFKFAIDRHSLLVEVDSTTFGFRCETWGEWRKTLHKAQEMPAPQYAKSPLKLLRQAEEQPIRTKTGWADALYRYYEYYQPVPAALKQLLTQARFWLDDIGYIDGQIVSLL